MSDLTLEQWQELPVEEQQQLRDYGASTRIVLTKTGDELGDIQLDKEQYSVITVRESDDSTQWRKIVNQLPLHHTAALYITAKDGFLLSELSVTEVVYADGTPFSSTKYAVSYYHGAMIISWAEYSLPV